MRQNADYACAENKANLPWRMGGGHSAPNESMQRTGDSRRRDCFVAALLAMAESGGDPGFDAWAQERGASVQNKANLKVARMHIRPVYETGYEGVFIKGGHEKQSQSAEGQDSSCRLTLLSSEAGTPACLESEEVVRARRAAAFRAEATCEERCRMDAPSSARKQQRHCIGAEI